MEFSYLKKGKLVKSGHPTDLDIDIKIQSNRIKVLVKAKCDLILQEARKKFTLNVANNQEAFFNGYQSWTDSKEVKLEAKEKNIYKSPKAVVKAFGMDKYGDAPFYQYENYLLHGYDVCYSKGENGFFIFNLNYKNAYLIFEFNKRKKELTVISDVKGLKMKAGDELMVMDYVFTYDYDEGLALFNKEFPKRNLKKLFGYTSWYNYYQDINEEIILRDLDAIDDRFNLFQIDDGFETFVGDWFDIDPKKFPNGLKPIVDKIHSKNLQAGVWLAPFVAEKESRLYKEHFDWIKKDEHGNPVNAGGNWSGQYSLDLENKEVIDYIKKFLSYYMELGFDFFKLDFLYASSIVIPEGYSRCQYQYKAYKLLKDILKDKIILGCGANIMNSYGNFDYLRVGPDVSLAWDDKVYMRLFHRERPSTKTTLQNTIYRSFMNDRLFANDPDVFLLRDNNIQMNQNQKHALAIINSLFSGVLMTSDDIGQYNKKQEDELNVVLNNFLHATNQEFRKVGTNIEISYEIEGQRKAFIYDYKNGVLSNGQ
ncbi:MAG: alpha-galactosidase [Bacilli bacterium]|nr:alpha-galactosidase [Bacilli bacterium]